MQTLEFAQLWNHTDNIGRAVALVLILMSITSWSVILGRGWDVWRLRRCLPTALSRFWSAPAWRVGINCCWKPPAAASLRLFPPPPWNWARPPAIPASTIPASSPAACAEP